MILLKQAAQLNLHLKLKRAKTGFLGNEERTLKCYSPVK